MALLRTASTLTTGLLLAFGSGLTEVAVAAGHPAARLAAEWDPGWSADEVGGRFTVDGYGVGGLGAYRLALDDGGAALAVCVQADVGHSMTVDYQLDPTPSVASAELDYLLWRMSGPPGIADDLTAAATNVLAWRYAGAVRSTGGTIWSGDTIEIAVIGSGRRTDIESAVAALHDEAVRRRGPWQLSDLAPTSDGAGLTARVEGPGGGISGVAVDVALGDQHWTVTTDADGQFLIEIPIGTEGRFVLTMSGPGPARTWSAPGSQRVAVAGSPISRQVEYTIAPPPTTTTTTSPPTTTTTIPPTTATVGSWSTTTTIPPTTTTTIPPTTTTVAPTISSTTSTTTTSTTTTVPVARPQLPTPPPLTPLTPVAASPAALPRTGGSARGVVRIGSLLVAIGGLTIFVTSRQRRTVT